MILNEVKRLDLNCRKVERVRLIELLMVELVTEAERHDTLVARGRQTLGVERLFANFIDPLQKAFRLLPGGGFLRGPEDMLMPGDFLIGVEVLVQKVLLVELVQHREVASKTRKLSVLLQQA